MLWYKGCVVKTIDRSSHVICSCKVITAHEITPIKNVFKELLGETVKWFDSLTFLEG